MPRLTRCFILLLPLLLASCEKPLRQRIQGEWKADTAAAKTLWTTEGTLSPGAQAKLERTLKGLKIDIGKRSVKFFTGGTSSSNDFEIVTESKYTLVTRHKDQRTGKTIDAQVSANSAGQLIIRTDYPTPGSVAVFVRPKSD